MNDTVLSVVLALSIILLSIWTMGGLFLFVVWRRAKRQVKRIETYVNQPTFSTQDINLVKSRGGTLTKDETNQIRDILRHRKEQEARDLNILDTASEFRREI
jgi:hypothetical protein